MYLPFMLPAHFHNVDGDLSNHNVQKIVGVANDNDLVACCFTCISLRITRSFCISCWALKTFEPVQNHPSFHGFY